MTIVMEVVLVCFLLSTLQCLPYKLEMAMLAIFSTICLYGALASLINCIILHPLLPLGVGAAYDRVGTKDSIMIRVPDHTMTVHLCDMTGPLAITSANPSGEADSTHHSMVISRLGHKLQGVLSDGESNQVVASTIVNCLKIDEGSICIVREGCVPAVQVLQIFERVKANML
uniref:Threonylcarbamoyl-AMP synthase n=1 Tax=Knipowitschia caucasica TaxID=637954 RepID=A0AAV2MJD4_KNICA